MATASTTEELNTNQKDWAKRLYAVRSLPRVLGIVWRSGPALVCSSIFLRVCVALMPLAMLAVGRIIVDGVAGISKGNPVDPNVLWRWVMVEFGLACSAAVLGRAIGFVESLIADRFTGYLTQKIMKHAAELDLSAFEDSAFYDQLERARAQATDRIRLLRSVGDVIQQGIVVATLCASLLQFSPPLLLILLVCIIPGFVGESAFAFMGYSLNHSQTPMRREIDYLRELSTSRASAKELRLFGIAKYLHRKFQRLWALVYRQNRGLARKRLLGGGALSLLTTAGYYACYAWVVHQAINKQISVGTMTFLAGAIAGASSSLQNLFSLLSGIADDALFLTDLAAFLDRQPIINTAEPGIPAPRPFVDGFRFENVSFAYAGSERNVLSGFNLHIPPGEKLALVGQNGEGKTTIVKLLTRLYDPTEGRILLDGIDLREYDVKDLERQIAVVFQDFIQYDMTVRENIGLGHVDYLRGANHHEQISRAAKSSMAMDVIAKLPAGFNQMLGRRFDKGVDLSGGEWQKIAIARAFLRDAQLMILDEPTASLDAPSELEMFERLASAAEGKIVVLISHRFSTVRMADRIVVLEGGRIVEQGSHARLVALGGRYESMFTLQAESYSSPLVRTAR